MRRASLLGCLLLSAGCSAQLNVGAPTGLPDCTAQPGRVNAALVLAAQSVPTAQWLPCVHSLPLGWNFEQFDARNGRTLVTLRSTDRGGDYAVTVALERSCDVSGAGETASEQPDARRYDKMSPASSRYRGDRYYVFQGGCISYHFDFRGRAGADSAAAVSAGVGFISRTRLADAVDQRSDGRVPLDPPAGKGRR